MAFEYAR